MSVPSSVFNYEYAPSGERKDSDWFADQVLLTSGRLREARLEQWVAHINKLYLSQACPFVVPDWFGDVTDDSDGFARKISFINTRLNFFRGRLLEMESKKVDNSQPNWESTEQFIPEGINEQAALQYEINVLLSDRDRYASMWETHLMSLNGNSGQP